MKDHTTAEIFEELWKRIEYDANVSEELATESNELQYKIDKAIEYINNHLIVDSYSPLYDEETKTLDDEFSYEDLLYILEDKIK